MDSERSDWHSDDDLASALERALDVPQGEAPASSQTQNASSGASIDDLFASLMEDDAAQAPVAPVVTPTPTATPVMDAPTTAETPDADEQVFESLDDFKPRTNFVPVQAPIDEIVVETTVEVTESVVAQPASSQVTMPVQWTPQRRSFDEIVFGSPQTN